MKDKTNRITLEAMYRSIIDVAQKWTKKKRDCLLANFKFSIANIIMKVL